METMKRPVLTLRFKRPATHSRLKRISDLIGSSMNEIAESAIERELDFLAADLQDELIETVEALAGWEYSESELMGDISAFAEGEASHRDPVKSTAASGADSVGVGDIFADPVER